jgi:hypothetical protein
MPANCEPEYTLVDAAEVCFVNGSVKAEPIV